MSAKQGPIQETGFPPLPMPQTGLVFNSTPDPEWIRRAEEAAKVRRELAARFLERLLNPEFPVCAENAGALTERVVMLADALLKRLTQPSRF